jgi:hypothetical protein
LLEGFAIHEKSSHFSFSIFWSLTGVKKSSWIVAFFPFYILVSHWAEKILFTNVTQFYCRNNNLHNSKHTLTFEDMNGWHGFTRICALLLHEISCFRLEQEILPGTAHSKCTMTFLWGCYGV